MSAKRIILLSVLALLYTFNLAAQDNSIEVYVHDNYTDKPLESALVSVLRHGVVVDSAYTDLNGVADIFIPATSVREEAGLPSTISLSHNYPNPFNEETKVEIAVPEAQTITLTIYNILGQRVASEQIPVNAGYYTLNMSLGHLATGVYFLRIDGTESQAIKLLKMGSGIRVSGPMFSITPSSPHHGTTLGKVLVDNFTIRVEKQQYELYESGLSIIEDTEISIPLDRNNIVEFVVVDEDNEPISKELVVEGVDIQQTITAPHTMTLKSGIYNVIGEIEVGVSIQQTFEISSIDTTIVLSFQEAGVILEGEPETPAVEATRGMIVPVVYPEETIEIDPELEFDGRVLRTEIEIIIDDEASIAEFNEFLDRYDARIVSMHENNTIFIIRVPDPGSIESLNQLVVDIKNESIIYYAMKSVIVERPELTANNKPQEYLQKIPFHIDSNNPAGVEHQLAARAHAAWNLSSDIRGLLDRPWLVIADWFGDGVPGIGYSAAFTNTDFVTGDVDSHGYHVLGIISGRYSRVPTLSRDQNLVTGIFPERLRVRAIDIQHEQITVPRLMDMIIQRIREIIDIDPDARIIVNTSLSHYGTAEDYAASWIRKVRGAFRIFSEGSGHEKRFIHFTAAGNVIGGLSWPAVETSMFSFAALGDVRYLGLTVPNLINTFVVENRVNTLHNNQTLVRPLPGCANAGSQMGGNLSAMGTDVWSFGDCLVYGIINGRLECIQYASDTHVSYQTGTSVATPQAAGVAAYVWSIAPTLSVEEVMEIISNTAEARPTNNTPGFSCHNEIPQPVVDAYAAVLAAGGEHARRVLFDVTGNGIFDHNDIEVFLDSLQYYDGALNYSRFDLNGDGLTGGSGTDRFDLTMNMEYSSSVYQSVEGQSVFYNENSLTDLEILCYYAYSDLYDGDHAQRSELLAGPCVDDNGHETGTVTDIDGNEYQTVKIGDQWWMAENLRVTRYRNGDAITAGLSNEEWQNTTSGAYAIYPHGDVEGINSDEDMVAAYGKLYNWYAVDDDRGLCPEGWHVPSDDEWQILVDYLGGREIAGGKMKSTRTKPEAHPRWTTPNEGATNESGFSGLPGGSRFGGGEFNGIGDYGLWLSSTEHDTYDYAVLGRRLWGQYSHVGTSIGIRQIGVSIRCLKD